MKICPLCSLQAWHTVGPQPTLVERMIGLGFPVSREEAEKRRASCHSTEQPAVPSWRKEQWAGKRGHEDFTEGLVASEASADTAYVLRPTSHFALPLGLWLPPSCISNSTEISIFPAVLLGESQGTLKEHCKFCPSHLLKTPF